MSDELVFAVLHSHAVLARKISRDEHERTRMLGRGALSSRLLLRFTTSNRVIRPLRYYGDQVESLCMLCSQRRLFSITAIDYAKKSKREDKTAVRDKQPKDDKEFDKSTLETNCLSVVSKLQKEITELKQGRHNPAVLNNLKISAEHTTLGKLADVSQKNPKTFLVTVYDPAHVKAVSAAIASSGQNFNPQPVPNNNQLLTINIPKDSSSGKAEKVKLLLAKAEHARTSIRHLRGESLKIIKSNGMSDDSQKRDEKDVGTVIDRLGKEIDKLVDNTKKDIDR